MATFTLSATLAKPYDDAVEAVRAALGQQGFGILTEIDLKATLKAKLDVDVAPQVILGACRPALAHEVLRIDPSIAAVLPCNVVVRALDEATTLVEAFDPDAMIGLADNDALHAVAADAKERLTAALAALTQED
ncbi:ABC transporter, ATP-binding protein [metagenome]|uniref:ABC transporter, ATP-binding protein n=1 Tax=metagenome TaxID=256318 RepID=A0A2P2CD01_9ZZZZ